MADEPMDFGKKKKKVVKKTEEPQEEAPKKVEKTEEAPKKAPKAEKAEKPVEKTEKTEKAPKAEKSEKAPKAEKVEKETPKVEASEEPSMDFGKKKKKTVKKEEPKEEPEETQEAPEEPSMDFGKKKKKTVKKEEPKEDEGSEEPIDFGKKPSKDKALAAAETKKEASVGDGIHSDDAKIYTYEFLAKRVFDLINTSGETEKTKYTMKPPVVYRDGTKKTVWVNFPEICKIMNRQPEHVLAFLLAEVGTTGSIDGNGRLVIKGRFQPKHIENVLRRYIAEYVKCQTCKTPETHLKKENRLLFMVCDKCGSTRTVSAIKTGFQATTRAVRRAART